MITSKFIWEFFSCWIVKLVIGILPSVFVPAYFTEETRTVAYLSLKIHLLFSSSTFACLQFSSATYGGLLSQFKASSLSAAISQVTTWEERPLLPTSCRIPHFTIPQFSYFSFPYFQFVRLFLVLNLFRGIIVKGPAFCEAVARLRVPRYFLSLCQDVITELIIP